MGGNATAFSTVVDGQQTLHSGDALRFATKPVVVGRALYFVVGQVRAANPYPIRTLRSNLHKLATAAGCEGVEYVLKRQVPLLTACHGVLNSVWALALYVPITQSEADTCGWLHEQGAVWFR